MKASTQIGTCPLCLRNGQELQDSHFQPAGVYRVLRSETEDNPNPFRFNDRGVFQDSKQVRDYLLCWDCEQRLSKNGENWFLAHCWRKDSFRLASMLDSASPQLVYPRTHVYHADKILNLSVSSLTYFGVSMFWRASVHRWEGSRGISLGSYEERFRKYLMDEASFPEHCALLVSVPMSVTPIAGLLLAPYGGRRDGYHFYKLVVLAVSFFLLVGKHIPAEQRRLCFVRGVGNPIVRSEMLNEAIMQDLRLRPRFAEELHAK